LSLLLPFAVVACGGDGDGGDDGSGPTTDPEPTETTTTPAPPEGPEEWVSAVQDVYARLDDLLAAPDPETVSSVFAESCPCYEVRRSNVEEFAGAGWHVERGPTTVLRVDLPASQPEGDDFVRLTVHRRLGAERVVDGDGEVVQEFPAEDAPSCTSMVLLDDGDGGAYRVHEEFEMTACPEVGA
jgi:hypothetical protein